MLIDEKLTVIFVKKISRRKAATTLKICVYEANRFFDNFGFDCGGVCRAVGFADGTMDAGGRGDRWRLPFAVFKIEVAWIR